MAAIEKIYGNQNDWKELVTWLAYHQPDLIKYVDRMPKEDKASPLALFPNAVNKYLLFKCPLNFVIKEILENYDYNIIESEIILGHEVHYTAKQFFQLSYIDFIEYTNNYLLFKYRAKEDRDFLVSIWRANVQTKQK